jgi:hypothetical protein
MVNLLRQFVGRLTALVPLECAYASARMSCSASFAFGSCRRTRRMQIQYESLFQHVHPLVIGAVDRSRALSTKLCIEILSCPLKDQRKAKKIRDVLNSGYPSHGYPITLREARRIGLHAEPLKEDVNQLLFELNEIYAEMGSGPRPTSTSAIHTTTASSISSKARGCKSSSRTTRTGTTAPRNGVG